MVSELNQVTNGRVLAKTGAEGVITAALPEQGLGIALKISDGNARARSSALLAILDHLGALTDAEKKQLKAHTTPEIVNSRGLIVGKSGRYIPGCRANPKVIDSRLLQPKATSW